MNGVTYPIAEHLSELGPYWSEVAVRHRAVDREDSWAWHLPWQDEQELLKGRDDGAYVTAQAKVGSGFVLLARRIKAVARGR